MPLIQSAEGFAVTFSRKRCAVLGGLTILFSLMMLAVGINVYSGVLDGTPFESLELTREPPWLWAGFLILGGVVLLLVSLWNTANAFRPAAAITVSRDGVFARTLIGKKIMRWDDADSARLFNGTLFVFPKTGAALKPVPLQTFLTGVNGGELASALAQYRPEIFANTESE